MTSATSRWSLSIRGTELIAGTIVVLVFVFAVPVVGESAIAGCIDCRVHYQVSLGCQILGVGDVYYQELSLGCWPPNLPYFGGIVNASSSGLQP